MKMKKIAILLIMLVLLSGCKGLDKEDTSDKEPKGAIGKGSFEIVESEEYVICEDNSDNEGCLEKDEKDD
jgi:uncharacterized protein YceK